MAASYNDVDRQFYVRGWARIQQLPDSENQMIAWENWFYKTAKPATSIDEATVLMNKE